MKNLSEDIQKCRICENDELGLVLDLNGQPPANSLRESIIDPLDDVPLKLVFCKTCRTLQLSSTVDPEYLFRHYFWVTATSSTAREYSNYFCEKILSHISKNNLFVVEVASNDGLFLSRFKDKGAKVLGIDPAENIAHEATNKGIPTKPVFFDVNIAKKITNEEGMPDLVIARNVIPHVKELHSIVEGLSILASKSTVVAIEFHYAKEILSGLHYDSIYHEHLFYFSINSLCALFERYGLFGYDFFESPISGGSVVILFSSDKITQSKDFLRMRELENVEKLNEFDTWRSFGLRAINHAKKLKNLVNQYYLDNGKLIAYGASARSSTLMNFANISSKEIELIIDKNPFKYGKFTPGTNIRITTYDEGLDLAKRENRNILLLAWNFKEEIVSELRNDGFKGDIIVPLPFIHVI
jgi:hypothetical protein